MLAKKLLFAGVSATAMIATNALAIDLLNDTGNLENTTLPYPVSNNQTAATILGDLSIVIDPSTSFPAGSLLLTVTLDAGATFATDVAPLGDLAGAGACAPMNISLSSGGSKGDSSVSVFVDNLDTCDGAATNGLTFTVDADVAGTTSMGVTLQTVGGLPVDGNGAGNPATLQVVRYVEPVVTTITADTTDTEATLASSFVDLTADKVLGTVTIVPNDVDLDGMGGMDVANNTIVVFNAGAGDDVVPGDYDVDSTFTGNFSAFDDGAMAAVAGIQIGTSAFTDPDAMTGDVVIEDTAGGDFTGGGATVTVEENGTDPIARTSVDVALTVDFAATTQMDINASGALEAIGREGTQIVWPWVSSGTQAAATGTTNVFRCANITGTASGAVFASILNSSALPASSFPAVTQIASGIPANGELVFNSQGLENALGVDFARADIELTIEEQAADLTCRRFIVRTEGVQSLGAGTVDQENDDLP